MTDSDNRTHFAMKAVGLSDIFRIKLGDQLVAGAVRYRAELSAPDGPSTGGGKQSVQHIKLVPTDGQGAVLVAGSANSVDKIAELRSFEHMAQLHAQRFRGQQIPLDRGPYNDLLRKLQLFFGEQRMSVVMTQAVPAAGGGRRQSLNAGLVLLFAGIALAVGGGLFFLLSMKR